MKKKQKPSASDEITVYIEKSERLIEQHLQTSLTTEKKAEIKRSDRKTKETIALRLERDAVLAHVQRMALALIAKLPSGPWGNEVWEVIRESEGDESFFRKISQTIRKAKQGVLRKPLIDSREKLLVDNWREVVIGDVTLPGLESWAWDAMASFLKAIGKTELSAQAWTKIMERAGLKRSKIEIAEFSEKPSANARSRRQFAITHRGPEKQTEIISMPTQIL